MGSLDDKKRQKLRASFRAGNLKIRSVSPEGTVEWRPIERVFKNPRAGRPMVELTTEQGPTVLTADHKVYLSARGRAPAGQLQHGDRVLRGRDSQASTQFVTRRREVQDPPESVYCLAVPPHRNFSLKNCIVANCPDQFYHFMPPQHEGRIGAFNRVFGHIWEDYELLLYLRRGLDDWNLHPPDTSMVTTIDQAWSFYPTWRSGITWAAITHACFALMMNWSADEFSIPAYEKVSVYLPSGKRVEVPIGELYDICEGSTG